jgi:hypothetical protein
MFGNVACTWKKINYFRILVAKPQMKIPAGSWEYGTD